MIPSFVYLLPLYPLAAQAALQVDLDSKESIKRAAAQVAEDLLKYYHGHEPGLIPGVLPGPPPDGPYYWWEAGAMWGTLLDYWHWTGDETYKKVTYESLLHQAGPNRDYADKNWSFSLGNDDQAFWGMSALIAAEYKFQDPPPEEAQWLALAQAVWNQQTAENLRDGGCGLIDERIAESDTWALWYRIGWSSTDTAILREINHVRCVVVVEMNAWKDPRHARQLRFAAWIDIFDEFKDWLWERLGKRNAEGRLYFPLGEEKDARIEKNKVLQHVVRWTMANMADGKFDGLDTAVFREGLDRAFSNLIYQWDTHFTDEPGFDVAKGEFTRYWTGWLTMRDKARKQGQGGSLTS
ncbi:hypothetical protein NUW58_g4079 [Xylaria curta]|uniref:Uncharacterized protein n=1 Tax=Xylaria curta TaxID=42375 RepID=A0ACC1PB16_9PEZI|nr:hypothetical protein NUW58_g4079 [Xylaria curta]